MKSMNGFAIASALTSIAALMGCANGTDDPSFTEGDGPSVVEVVNGPPCAPDAGSPTTPDPIEPDPVDIGSIPEQPAPDAGPEVPPVYGPCTKDMLLRPFEVRIGAGTRPASIVVAGNAEPFSSWDIVNPNDCAAQLSQLQVRQGNTGGDVADIANIFTSLGTTPALTPHRVETSKGAEMRWNIELAPTATTSEMRIPAHGVINIKIYGQLNPIVSSAAANGSWTGVARSGHTPSLELARVNATFTELPISLGTAVNIPAPPMTIRRSKPLVTRQLLSTTTLANSDQDLYAFQVAAPDVGGIAFKQVTFDIEKHYLTLSNFRLRRGSTDIDPSQVLISDANETDLRTGSLNVMQELVQVHVSFAPGVEESISDSGNVYTLHATVGSSDSRSWMVTRFSSSFQPMSNGEVSLTGKLNRSGSAYGVTDLQLNSFAPTEPMIWSDLSETSHSPNIVSEGGSADWITGGLLDLGVATQTLER